MADAVTPILNLLLQETGGNNNSWGVNLNDEVITPLENAVKGCLTISGLTGGGYSLTQDSAVYQTIKLQGTLASDLTITLASATANKWVFINELTTAGFYVIIKQSGQTGCNIPHGKITEISTDGTNMYRHDRESIGELFYFAGATLPGGCIECTGATPLRASAIDLFAKIGTTWGTGNGTTTFTIPDGYTAGKFLRSRTASVAIATAQTSQNKAHTHGGSGTTSTENQSHTHAVTGNTGNMSANASHSHTYSRSDPGAQKAAAAGTSPHDNYTTQNTSSTSTEHTHSFSVTSGEANQTHTHTYSFTTDSNGGTEARPENLSAMLCIRY